MLTIIVTMVAIIVLAGLVLVYVAFPHRGEELPAAPWLGDVMAKAVEAAPTLDEAETDHQTDGDTDRAPAHRL